jgi:hypothetical protein
LAQPLIRISAFGLLSGFGIRNSTFPSLSGHRGGQKQFARLPRLSHHAGRNAGS